MSVVVAKAIDVFNYLFLFGLTRAGQEPAALVGVRNERAELIEVAIYLCRLDSGAIMAAVAWKARLLGCFLDGLVPEAWQVGKLSREQVLCFWIEIGLLSE